MRKQRKVSVRMRFTLFFLGVSVIVLFDENVQERDCTVLFELNGEFLSSYRPLGGGGVRDPGNEVAFPEASLSS